jgi:hypothetical protein
MTSVDKLIEDKKKIHDELENIRKELVYHQFKTQSKLVNNGNINMKKNAYVIKDRINTNGILDSILKNNGKMTLSDAFIDTLSRRLQQ